MPKIKVTDIDADASASAKGLVQLTGCLGGTATSPTVVAVKESGGATLTLGSMNAGQFLKVGTNQLNGTNELFLTSNSVVGSNGYSSTSASVTKPVGLVNDDVVFLFAVSDRVNGVPMTPPAGFSTLYDLSASPGWDAPYDIYTACYYKVITNYSSEPSSYSISGADGIISYKVSNAKLTNLFNGNAYSLVVNPSGNATATCPALTTTVENTLILQFVAQFNSYHSTGNTVSSQSSTPTLSFNDNGKIFGSLWAFTKSATGAVSPLNSQTLSATPNYGSCTFTIAVQSSNFSAILLGASNDSVPNAPASAIRMFVDNGTTIPKVIEPSGGSKTLGHPVKYKTADESVSSSTALQNDDHLAFAIGANEIWEFDIDAPVTVGTGGIKVSVNAPASPTGFTADMQILDGTSVVAMSRITTPDTELANAGALTTGRVKIHGVIENGANAGNVLLRFAQQASDAAATAVKKYSTITYRKIG